MKERIKNWLDSNMKDDVELQKSKIIDEAEGEEEPLFNFLLIEIERFYNEFAFPNETIERFLERKYKDRDFFEAHEELADDYYEVKHHE